MLSEERMCSVRCVLGTVVRGLEEGLTGERRENVFCMIYHSNVV